ncbi:MAG: biosynthetic arginine decarboxylase [Bdellovibrionales bacterium]|nr:biosynthetic arginine decarboxylase [Bdellovibrionales bacterium]
MADTVSESWSPKDSAELYGLDYWGNSYFSVNDIGNVILTPNGTKGPAVDLLKVTEDLKQRGIRVPILLRFPDIVKSRIELINSCFKNAIESTNYMGRFQGVYPVKVNQQKHLVEEIVEYGTPYNFGLEAGSKPELLIALAMLENPEALIICNGFKDKEYIEMALVSQKMGRNTIIVVDRWTELQMIIEASKELGIRPKIGLRAKLNSQAEGKWAETSGTKSKFGLTPSEIVYFIEVLKKEDMLNCLQLLHFHIGSQIPSILSIKSAIREGARFYTELWNMGATLKYLDVGGGLGVDYDGSGKSDNSRNYDEQEYANDVVWSIQQVCDEKNIPHPNIVTESGRSLVAHSSMLIFDVVGRNELRQPEISLTDVRGESPLVRELYEIFQSVNKKNINESYNDLLEKKRDTKQLFAYGVLSLEQRAKAEDLYWATATKIADMIQNDEEHESIYFEIESELCDTFFCNFSLFQSLPDSWALNQVFPVMPIHRLEEKPSRRAVLADLTCDSDGNIDSFIDSKDGGTHSFLPVHKNDPSRPYYMAVFMTGAYQEILGDMHNLFGDTDAVHISVKENGYSVDRFVQGDDIQDVLAYVDFHKAEMLERVRKSTEKGIESGVLTPSDARLLIKRYEEGLSRYTYLA